MKVLKNNWLICLLLLVAYSLIYFFYTKQYPWLFNSQLFGKGYDEDMSQFLWNAHHFGEWLNGRQGYLQTDNLYAPLGTSLQYHTYCHLMAASSYLSGNSFLTINLFIWLHYIFSGLGAYLLSRYFKLHFFWAFIVGFIFAFIPYKFCHLNGHYNLQQTAFIPFFILVFFKAFPLNYKEALFSKLKLWHIITLVVLGILCVLSCYVYSVYLFFFGLAYFLYYFIFRLLPRPWMRLGLFVLLTILATFLIPYLMQLGIDDKGGFWWRDDMGKFFTPNWNNLFYGKLINQVYNNYARLGLKHSDCFMGFLLPLLLLIGTIITFIKRRKSDLIPLLGFFSLFFFMLMSPEILVYKTKIGYFPTAIYHFIPVINNSRIPERFIVIFALFFPMLVFSLLQLLPIKNKILKWLLPCIVFVYLMIEYAPEQITKCERRPDPAWVQRMKQLPSGNILPLPTGVNDGNVAHGRFSSAHLYYQSVHKHKLIGGYISRITTELREKYTQNIVFRSLLDASNGEDISLTFSDEEIDTFVKEYEVKYIVTEKKNENFIDFIRENFSKAQIEKEVSADETVIFVLK